MKIKLFYKQAKESVSDFERRVNDFLSKVTVIDVKYTQAFYSDFKSEDAIMVQYKS